MSINWQTGSDAESSQPGTDSDMANCTTIRPSAAQEAMNLVTRFGTALRTTEKSPGNLLSGEERDRLAIIRHNRQRGYLPDLKQIDFMLDLLRRFGA